MGGVVREEHMKRTFLRGSLDEEPVKKPNRVKPNSFRRP
jgi:hypothetical protein